LFCKKKDAALFIITASWSIFAQSKANNMLEGSALIETVAKFHKAVPNLPHQNPFGKENSLL